MRDGIKIKRRIEFEKGDVSITHPESNSVIQKFFDVVGDQWNKFSQTVSNVAAEFIENYDVESGGYIFIKNLDSTNYVSLMANPVFSDEIVRIGPGKVFWCRTGPSFYTDFKILANTAPCDCLIIAVDA